MYQTLRYEKQENIGILTINRPEALNALNSTVIGDLEQAITEVEKDAELGALIITGEGRSFVAGADIGEQLPLDVAGGRKWGQRGSALMRRIEKLEIPTIAAVNGFALGGGCELAMSCDIILAAGPNAEGKGGAKFGQPEVGLGITPGFSGTQRLPRRVGIAKAILIAGALELGRRAFKDALACPQNAISSSRMAYEAMRETMENLDHEEFHVIFLSNAAIEIARELIGVGGQSATAVDVKVIARKALEHKATRVILYHNHPSGTLRPSIQDDSLTSKIRRGLELLDIRVDDHIIITSKGYFSYNDEGRLHR